jgi:hypothetical protein
MTLIPNDGSRPSRLALDRYATGELDPQEAAAVEAALDDHARAHLAAVERTRAELPELDVAHLRRRADVEAASPAATPANDSQGFRWMGPIALVFAAAVALVIAVPRLTRTDPPDVLFRGGEQLTVFEVQGDTRAPYEPGQPLGEGDVVGFGVTASGHDSVVLVSIDGTGGLAWFFPETAGGAPVPLETDGVVALPESITLDGAPGPEVFVAVFDRPAAEAAAEVERAYAEGGHEGLVRWAEATPGVEAVEVTRR